MAENSISDHVLISRLTEFVLNNLQNEDFGVNDLARYSGRNPDTLNRKLKSLTGMNINRFIREVRLRKALEILQEESVTASEVAYMVGFSSPAYFNKCFHQLFGYPPGRVKSHVPEASGYGLDGPAVEMSRIKKAAWPALFIYLAGIIVLVSSGVLTYFAVSGKNTINSDATGIYTIRSVAVLPFKNLSNNIEDQYFIDGVMDEICISLTKIRELGVNSRTSVEQFRNSDKTIFEIAERLKVNYIVEGSGQKYGDRLRLRIQLIEASNDRHLWADSYEVEIHRPEEFFRIQSQIAGSIASKLKANITPREMDLIERLPTADMTAYESYLKANEYQKEFSLTRDLGTYNNSITLYKVALQRDSSFSNAYSGLASIYLTRHFTETYFESDYLDSCLFLAGRALSFNPLLDEAYHITGRCYFEKGEIAKSLENFDKSLEINPNNGDALSYKGYLLTSIMNDYVGGIDAYQKALEVSPPEYGPELLRGLGQAYLDVGFIKKAKKLYKKAFGMDGDKGLYLMKLSDVEYCLEDYGKAIKLGYEAGEADSAFYPETTYFYGPEAQTSEAYRQAKRLIGRYEITGSFNLQQSHRVGYVFWKVGNYGEAKRYFDQQINYSVESIRLQRRIARNKAAYYDLAATYTFLGNTTLAYQCLDEFASRNFYPLWWVSLAKHDPLFDRIRNDEKFQGILLEMQDKYQAERIRVRKWLKAKGAD